MDIAFWFSTFDPSTTATELQKDNELVALNHASNGEEIKTHEVYTLTCNTDLDICTSEINTECIVEIVVYFVRRAHKLATAQILPRADTFRCLDSR